MFEWYSFVLCVQLTHKWLLHGFSTLQKKAPSLVCKSLSVSKSFTKCLWLFGNRKKYLAHFAQSWQTDRWRKTINTYISIPMLPIIKFQCKICYHLFFLIKIKMIFLRITFIWDFAMSIFLFLAKCRWFNNYYL